MASSDDVGVHGDCATTFTMVPKHTPGMQWAPGDHVFSGDPSNSL